ncbi:endocytosis defective- protein [Basidiobolus ranarum]|uniref:Endocytosis protein 3 n=1 Tax=Basidiobolus ranarum TaxID=34480 RepID=A0ABR2WZI7_9FUNG
MEFQPGERERFGEIFNSLNPVNGYLSGEQARNVFLESGLNVSILEKIWDLADMDKDGAMTFDEFAVAMKFIYESINGQPLPNSVPSGLLPRSNNLSSPNNSYSGYQNTSVPSPQTYGMGSQGTDAFDWNVPLSDKFAYESIFTKYTDDGQYVAGNHLDELFQSFNLSNDEIYAAWQLVDVKNVQQLNKEQFITFLHIINHLRKGLALPQQCPQRTINGFKLDGNNNSRSLLDTPPQSMNRNKPLDAGRVGSTPSKIAKNAVLAESYLTRVGASSAIGRSSTFTSGSKYKVSDEEEKLQKELAELERSIEEKQKERDLNAKVYSESTNSKVKDQLQALYKFKQLELANKKELVENVDGNSDQTTRQMQLDRRAIDELKMNIRNLKNQKQSLESHINSTQQELEKVLKEIEMQKST